MKQDIFYEGYIGEYKKAMELLQKRKSLQDNKVRHEQEKRQKLLNLKKLMAEITELKSKQAEILQIQEIIKVKTAIIQGTSSQIQEYRKRCHDKQTRILHWDKVLKLFKKEFTEEFKLNEKKYQDLNTLEIIHLSRQRVMLYELGSVLFNQRIAEFIYSGIYELHKTVREERKDNNKIATKTIQLVDVTLSPANKETEISTGLGYCVLLLNTLSKLLNVPLKYPMYFCGSSSLIMRKQNENYPLYITKVFDKNKFHAALRHLLQNIMQVLEYFEVDISERKPSFRKQMETLIKILAGEYP